VDDGRFTYSANISLLFTEAPYLERPRLAAAAGFQHVETWWPFAGPYPEAGEVDRFVAALADAGVSLTALNFYAGDMPAGERGLCCRPDRQEELRASAAPLLEIARRTGCRHFNLLYGQLDDRWTPEEQAATAVAAIRDLAAEVDVLGGTVLLEPLAAGLNGAYPLTTGDDVIGLLRGALASTTNVSLLFDLFHLGSNGSDLVDTARRLVEDIGHVQVADAPGRGEPGSGELPVAETLDALHGAGYRGLIGCEYRPTRSTGATLDWIRQPTA